MESLDMLNKLQDAVINENKDEQENHKHENCHFDKLKMYFGDDYDCNGIVVSMPTIGDILNITEERFYQAISPFLYNSTSIRVFLWDKCDHTDWNNVADIEVFNLLNQMNDDKEPLKLLFKNTSFDDFQLMPVEQKQSKKGYELALYSKSQDILVYEKDYMQIAEYIREMLNIHPKVEKAKSKTAKAWILQEDRMNQGLKKENNQSVLLPYISACLNHPSFKYKLNELKEVGIYQFMDCVKRIQKYENFTALMNGLYCGFRDLSKVDKEQFDFTSDV